MFLLHPNLALLAKVVGDTTRYALSGIRIARGVDALDYRAEATDGKCLIRVDGMNVCAAEQYPQTRALTEAPDTAPDGLLPIKPFVEACKGAPRNGPQKHLRCVAVKLALNDATLQSGDLDSMTVRQPRLIEGRFPNTDLVFPKTQPQATVSIDASRLGELLAVVAALTSPESNSEVLIEVRRPTDPIVLRCKNTEQSTVALFMPLSAGESKK